MSSISFVVSSLDAIEKHAGTRNKPLAESVQKAKAALKEAEPQLPDPEVIFAPLQLASRSPNPQLANTALDCIGKLISYSYFTPSIDAPANSEDAAPPRAPLIERAIDTICDCFQGDATPTEIQVQIVKSLLAAVLNDKIVVHGAGLLKAVRQIYNVFLLSRNTTNQQVAQGTLTQMVGTVFERVKTRLQMKQARINAAKAKYSESSIIIDPSESVNGHGDAVDDDEFPEPTPSELSATDHPRDTAKLTLQDMEHQKTFDDSHIGDGPTTVTRLTAARKVTRSVSERSVADVSTAESGADDSLEALEAEDEIYIRDAYLVFRSFCNLSTKVLPPDVLYDLRGQPMRSKLISLHLIHTLLNNHMEVFISPLCTITNTKTNETISFLQAIKFYLCLSISRNGASAVDRVFDVCCNIFWLMLKFMRFAVKPEIEVFLSEIYLAVLQRKSAPLTQKLHVVSILQRFSEDPKALVEAYLNYDCDRTTNNVFQTMVETLSKYATAAVAITPAQEQLYEEKLSRGHASEWQSRGTMPPPLSVAHIMPHADNEHEIPREYVMKRIALDALVDSLRSMVNWSEPGRPRSSATKDSELDVRFSQDGIRESFEPDHSSRMETPIPPSTPTIDDDPEHLEREKARKTAFVNAVRAFNVKPKKGIKALLEGGFIPSQEPEDIAKFLLAESKLDKAQIGEYLGEGDPKNIEIMHAFVDSMEFTKKRFVDALRTFLQTFRLPGEAQKIDRFMLKFANRYVLGNPNAFANADTAYVLSYSVIMLNTDLHSSKIARRMSKEDFIRNNRGINDDADLPPEYLIGIYDEIASNEIVLNSEREAAAAAGVVAPQATGLAAGLGITFANVGRDLQREAYVQQSEEIASRSEQLFKTLYRNERRNAERAGTKFIPATSFKHIGPMFDVTWMSYFSAFSSQMQKAQNLEINKLCLDGMKQAIKIACLFDLTTPREAFVSALRNSTHLNTPQEMHAKNVEALKAILDLGQTEGNLLRESWKDVLMCISQLDRLQLITGGVDESSVPDVSKARFVPPSRAAETNGSAKSNASKRHRPRANTGPQGFSMAIALEARSDEIIKSVDRIFTNTANMNGDAMLHFARALTEVSWDEIKVSGAHDSPRMYSLQKIVEISYYNMTRVRFEWTQIWDVLGDHFNQAGCHINETVVIFSIDSLRQLSMRFMELEELPGFKFQKDFLKPFEHVMANSSSIRVKELILQCTIQMIQARGDNIRSGWRTLFGIFSVSARDPHESIVNEAFENVMQIYKTGFGTVISQGAFTDFIVCLTEFSKNSQYQKKSLQAMETLKSVIPRMLKTPECPLSQRHDMTKTKSEMAEITVNSSTQPSRTSVEEAFWFPVLFAFHDVLMTGEDLEVRSNALNYFFEALLRYGGDFPASFWDTLWRQQLYPIFIVLRSRPEMKNALNQEELSVWLSTTMIQALRNMITLFTHYFDSLEYMLDRFLELLALCICQENDTIARIGSNCLQQLILQNVTKFSAENWSKIVAAFCGLFERTTAVQLFSAATSNSTVVLSPTTNGFDLNGGALSEALPSPSEESSLKLNDTDANGDSKDSESASLTQRTTPDDTLPPPEPASSEANAPLEEFKPSSSLQQQPIVVTAARRRFFNRIIHRCVLQLLLIETVNELFSNDTVYAQIPSVELLRLMAVLKRSYQFAKKFNNDKDLRMKLWREGFMKQPPNLLKQESGAAATYVAILFRMFADTDPKRSESREEVERALVPLCQGIIKAYIELDDDSQHRNIVAWRPVVVDVLEGYAAFPDEAFRSHVKNFYGLVVELMGRELSGDLRAALLLILRRVGEVELGIKGLASSSSSSSSSSSNHRENGHLSAENEEARRRASVASTMTVERRESRAAEDHQVGGDASSVMMGR